MTLTELQRACKAQQRAMVKPIDLEAVTQLKNNLQVLAKRASIFYSELPPGVRTDIFDTIGQAWELVEAIEASYSVSLGP